MLTPTGATVLFDRLSQALGRPLSVPPLRPVAGGDINTALAADTPAGRLFIKYQAHPQALAMFQCEVEGLRALRHCEALVIPEVVWWGELPEGSALVLRYLNLQTRGDQAALGRALAALHTHSDSQFGWPRDNFIGRSQQANGPCRDWAKFFWLRRLRPQLDAAAARGLSLAPAQCEALKRRTDELLDHRPTPALVHGDLWRGNVGWVAGAPALFDPAVHFADGEVDLALARLFGGFDREFFEAYTQARPLPPGADRREALYNLYHLLNHFNLFGGGYRQQCQARVTALLSGHASR